MSKELKTILKHLLDNSTPGWEEENFTLVYCMNSLTDNKASKRFQPPELHEVVEELRSQKVRHYHQQAEKFWNFYESKNWMIGKNKMKSWKAAIKTWNFEKDNIIL
jgi:hypothetical protein